MLLALALIGATAASGNSVYRACEGFVRDSQAVPLEDLMLCGGYFRGFNWGLYVGANASGGTGGLICLPEGYNHDQGIRVFVQYVTEHPERMHMDEDQLVAEAFIRAFPCA